MDNKKKRLVVIGGLVVALFFLSNMSGGSNSYLQRTLLRTVSNVLSDQISSGVNDYLNTGTSSSKYSSSSSSSSSSSNSSSSTYIPTEDLDFVYESGVCVGVLVDGVLKEFNSSGNLKGVSSKLNKYIKDDLKSRGSPCLSSRLKYNIRSYYG